jgi:hypothetical protein
MGSFVPDVANILTVAIQNHNSFPFFTFPQNSMRTFRWFNRVAVLLAMVALVAAAGSCGNNSTASSPSKTELLTRAGGWKFDRFTQGDLGLGVAAYPGMVLKFTSSGSMTISVAPAAVAAIKALRADIEPSYTGTWAFAAGETQISFNAPPLFSIPLRISELSATTLLLTGSVPGTTQVLESRWTAN